jgi:polyhydroxyalkanoate synthesis regulator phasin
MRLSRKLIVAAGVAVAAGSSAVAVAATQGGSKGNDPHPLAARGGPGWGGGPHGAAWAGGPRGKGADTRGVLDAIRKAVVDHVVTVAGPIVDQAVKDGDLTQAQGDTAKQALADVQAGKRPSMDAFALLRDEQVRAVAQKVAMAAAPGIPGLAQPILDQAVKDGKLTRAQADELAQHIKAFSDRAGQGAFGRFGPGHHHRGAPGRFDRGAADVLRDVFGAVRKQAPSVAGPIVDQAVKDGKLTRAQADELKAVAAQAAKDGRPHLFEHRDLLRDADVREVARDISRALVKQAPGIGGPIIDQAVNDGKLTQEQGDRAKERLADMAQRAGG